MIQRLMCLAAFTLLLPAFAKAQSVDSLAVQHARKFVEQLEKGDFQKPVESFSSEVAKSITADRLGQIWNMMPKQYGPYEKHGATYIDRDERRARTVVTPLQYEKGMLALRMGYDDSLRIIGIYFTPLPDPRKPYKLPEYATADSYEEIAVEIVSGNYKLPGILTRPKGKDKYPVLLMVQGSGPHDADETIGPNKPFKDMAAGLATRGIGSLRFDKRTLKQGEKMTKETPLYTVREEVLDDVKAADAWLRQARGAEVSAVYVMGHSLGGMLLPRIAADLPEAAGFVMLAAPARPLEELILEQSTYLLSLDGQPGEKEQKKLDEIRVEGQRVKDLKAMPKPGEKTAPLMGLPVSYWHDLNQNPPLEQIASFGERPLLLLQGGRDYQVTLIDYQLWEKALKGRPRTSLRLMEDLNHLFIKGAGKSKPQEYQNVGHVSREVVEAIAEWILK